MKQVIRLTESDLHNIINESVRRIINEHDYDEWDEDDSLDGYPSDQEVDVVSVYFDWNKGELFDTYNQETDEEEDPTYKVLEEYLPTAIVHIDSDYEEYDRETNYGGGYSINRATIDEDDANILKELEQNGQIPQGLADDLIAAIEDQGEEQAQDWIDNQY